MYFLHAFFILSLQWFMKCWVNLVYRHRMHEKRHEWISKWVISTDFGNKPKCLEGLENQLVSHGGVMVDTINPHLTPYSTLIHCSLTLGWGQSRPLSRTDSIYITFAFTHLEPGPFIESRCIQDVDFHLRLCSLSYYYAWWCGGVSKTLLWYMH